MFVLSGLYFMSYAHVLQEFLVDHSRIFVVRLLLQWITDHPDVKNRKGNIYTIDDGMARDLEIGKYDVPRSIKTAVAEIPQITMEASKHFSKILDKVIPQRDNDLYRKMWALIDASDVPEDTLGDWRRVFDKQDYAQFLADVFLYALEQPAPTKSKKRKEQATGEHLPNDVIADVDILNKKILELAQKVHLEPIPKPPMIAPGEHAFIMQLFRAYGSIDHKCVARKEDLSSRLKTDLEIRRNDFYAAETIRIQGTDALRENGASAFAILENEVFDASYDVWSDDYKDGFTRMKKVMAHISNYQCVKSLFSQTRWIGAAENKGICHILAGEERLPWVLDNE